MQFAMMTSGTWIFCASLFLCAVMVSGGARYLRRSEDLKAVQAAHSAPTPRTGGVAVVIAMGLGFWLFAPEALAPLTYLFLLSLIPVFSIGVAEDLGALMSPRRRLFAAALSSVMVIVLLDVQVTQVDVPGLDWALGFAGFGFLFTVLWMTGLCHATNLIDGLNGLAAGSCILTAIGIVMIAEQSGDADLAVLAAMVIPAILGFLVLNWPFGKVFLGDGGAYTLGHVLGWLGIFLLARNPEIAGTAVGLLFFWPVADTFFAMYRRYRAGVRPDEPDRLHFHQLVMRALEILILGRRRRRISNPLAALVLMPMVAAPIFTGVLLWDRPFAALFAIGFFAVLFVSSYVAGMRLARKATLKSTQAFRRARDLRGGSAHAGSEAAALGVKN
jgi:UDP-N-acetylmuramyl pentapeptide phosphotransferase/UDP-N-acetylglucosamine-1-phosphate transferase